MALPPGEANLPKASVVNVSQVLTVDKSELVDYVGKLTPATCDAVRNGLQLLFEKS